MCFTIRTLQQTLLITKLLSNVTEMQVLFVTHLCYLINTSMKRDTMVKRTPVPQTSRNFFVRQQRQRNTAVNGNAKLILYMMHNEIVIVFISINQIF